MVESNEVKHSRSAWDLAWDIFPAEMRPLLGLLFYMIVFVTGVFAIVAIPVALYRAATTEHEHCWVLQEIHTKWYRFNQCSGDLIAAFKVDPIAVTQSPVAP